MIRSKRPGRLKAASRCHGAFVAPRKMPSLLPMFPSISARNWLIMVRIALSRKSFRSAAKASTSSKKRIARRVFPGQLKRLMEVFFTITDVKIQDLMDSDRDEIGLNFAGGRLADQRFPATRRPIEQHPAPNFFAVGLEESTVLQRINDLHPYLFLDLLHAADSRERNLRLLDVPAELLLSFSNSPRTPTYPGRTSGGRLTRGVGRRMSTGRSGCLARLPDRSDRAQFDGRLIILRG